MDLPGTFIEGFHHKNAVSKMPYNKLGNTDMLVSKIGLGGVQFNNSEAESEIIETVIESVKRGINYIDVAPWYGFGLAEIILGKALAKIPRKSYYIATKVGRYRPEVELMFDFTAEKTLSSVDESLEKLGVEYVDLIQVHDLEFAPPHIVIKETLPALQKIVDQGKARYIGITGYPLEPLKEVLLKSRVGIDTVLSYCRYNIFDQVLADYIPVFKDKKLGIINAGFLGMGLLTPNPVPVWHCASDELQTACRKANQYCKENGVSLPHLSANYALKLAGVNIHLVGFTNLDLMEKNLQSVYNGLTEFELKIQSEIITRLFQPLKSRHWESVELEKYRRKLAKN